jgi:hypothetical protein
VRFGEGGSFVEECGLADLKIRHYMSHESPPGEVRRKREGWGFCSYWDLVLGGGAIGAKIGKTGDLA